MAFIRLIVFEDLPTGIENRNRLLLRLRLEKSLGGLPGLG